MRYLKLYEEFDEIPSNFIRLDSIGHVLDPEEGIIYAMWKKGGYDHENGYEIDGGNNYFNDGEDHYADGLSNEDMSVIDKYLLSCEPVFKDKINFDLMQTAKEISLDFLDDGYTLVSQVLIESDEKYEDSDEDSSIFNFIDYLVYSEMFSHRFTVETEKKYSRFFSNRMKAVKSKSDLIYRFCLRPASYSRFKVTANKIDEFNEEIFDRLKGMFPDENIVSK
jgi:hypothetical protein